MNSPLSKELDDAQCELRELRIKCGRDILDADLWTALAMARERVWRAAAALDEKNRKKG